jgi:hypothetical protein
VARLRLVPPAAARVLRAELMLGVTGNDDGDGEGGRASTVL